MTLSHRMPKDPATWERARSWARHDQVPIVPQAAK
jgi:hypothetical protein